MIMELKVGYDEDTIEAANHYEKVCWESFVGYNHIPNDPSKEALLDHQFVMSILEALLDHQFVMSILEGVQESLGWCGKGSTREDELAGEEWEVSYIA